jgi:predicted transposase/invertase (TIGR01784 family)
MENYVPLSQLSGTSELPDDIRQLARENASQGKPLNILLDVVFKDVFTADSEDSRNALISLLSACTHREVSDVQVKNTEIIPDYLDGKLVRLDVHVVFNDGEAADLEMQMELGDDNTPARAVFYAIRLLSGQAEKGEYYGDIKRVYMFFFINAVLFPDSPLVPRRYTLLEKTTHEPLNDLIEIVFYELPKLEAKVRLVLEGKAEVETLSPEERWCTFFRYQHDESKAELVKLLTGKDGGIMSAEKVLSKASRNYDEWAKALFREKAEMDYRSGMYVAEMKGYKEAEALYEVKLENAEQRVQQERRDREAAEQRAAELERKLRKAGL